MQSFQLKAVAVPFVWTFPEELSRDSAVSGEVRLSFSCREAEAVPPEVSLCLAPTFTAAIFPADVRNDGMALLLFLSGSD